MSKVNIRGANELLWPRGLIIGATLDASETFSKSGILRGFKGAQGAHRGPKLVKDCIYSILKS